jgi:dipeptidyl-peptidase-4
MRKSFSTITFLVMVICLQAQSLPRARYEKAASLRFPRLNNKTIFNLSIQPNWNADSSGFIYVTQDQDGKTFMKYDVRSRKAEPLVNHDLLSQKVSALLNKELNKKDMPVTDLRWKEKNKLTAIIDGKTFTLDLSNYSVEPVIDSLPNEMESVSPDGNWVAYTSQYNLFIRSTKSGEVKQLSRDGEKNYEYASYYGWGEIIEGENGERPAHFNVQWSPDSKWIQTFICDLRSGSKMYLLDWSIDTLYRPKLLSYYRGSPGDTNMVYMTPVIFNIETGEEIRKDEFRNVNAASLEWSKEPGKIFIENQRRGYQQIDLYQLDLNRKRQELLYSETSPTNIDTYQSMYIPEWNQFIVLSERDGWRQLYLLDIPAKKLTPLTNGEFYISSLEMIDKKTRNIFFTASGKEKGRNPYLNHLYKFNIIKKQITLLTPENLNHGVWVSPDGKLFVDNMSSLNQPTKTVLRETQSGKIIHELARADIDGLTKLGFRFPEPFAAIGRDGSTTIYGAIWKPTDFDSSKKYPIIDQSYTGPHTNMFPRSFTAGIARSNQALAELGFIVVTIDGMGTAGRSKAFHNVSYKNMGRNLLDHVLAIRQLSERYAWIDTHRVGIFGHSAGGYDAGHAMLEFPEFYKVAVASSADHDFRMEKDWWPEMYMGWPVDSTYHLTSNITMAGNLKGKLLIVHGGIDENVNPSATFKLAEALVKADKQFDMLIFPSQRHGYQGKFSDYFTKKLWNYFVEHLLHAPPVWDFRLN